ncbi:MAG: hypothetical protein RIB45_04390 [Marivibrio sp.]|uniref:hypothetical protein n=1 Tax=Marivibrio sp. TaxID=2039719 RepID=UPI0032EEF95B
MNNVSASDSPPRVALVVFSDRTGIRWMRLLPRGFRHCFVLLPDPSGWLAVDSLADRVVVSSLDGPALVRLLRAAVRRGDRILPTAADRRSPRRKRAMRPFTCVELTLRLLGLQPLFVLTPIGLFRFISRLNESMVDK